MRVTTLSVVALGIAREACDAPKLSVLNAGTIQAPHTVRSLKESNKRADELKRSTDYLLLERRRLLAAQGQDDPLSTRRLDL